MILACVDTGVAIYNKYASDTATNEVGIAAHLGGMATGLLLGIPVLKNIDQKPWETIVFWIALIVYLVAVIFAILWNAFWPASGEPMQFPLTDWTPLLNSSMIPIGCQ